MDTSKGHLDITLNFQEHFKGLAHKADKISQALFLISNYVSHKTMNERLQSVGVDFIEVSYMLHPFEQETHIYAFQNLECITTEAKSLTQSLSIVGVLSHSNKKLLHDEIELFIKQMKEYVQNLDQQMKERNGVPSPIFDSEFFSGSTALPTPSSLKDKKNIVQEKKLEKDILLSFNKNLENDYKGHSLSLSHESKGHDSIVEKQVKFSKTDMVDRMNRKANILSFIRENKAVAIKDILSHIHNCSEKTIQRELNDLVKDGVLKKEGERRWSKYSLLKDK